MNFRLNLIEELTFRGYRAIAIAPPDKYASSIPNLSCLYIPLTMSNMGRNPFQDFLLLARYVRILKRERPHCLLGFTVKPNIYGSIAARLLGIPVINNIAGLGSAFGTKGPLQFLVKQMYRAALYRSKRVFFQNPDDHRFFIESGIVDQSKTEVLPGSGVDTTHFSPRPPTKQKSGFAFLFVGRLLREKGVLEYFESARVIKAMVPATRFQVLGFTAVSNPSAIQPDELRRWVDDGVIEYLGETEDVRPHVADADCVVLPSYYREGVPRSLLEAAAMGKPIITTDMPGCREAVVEGESGLLVAPRSIPDLIQKMSQMLALPKSAREEMGRKGRRHVEARFDERIVLSRYVEVIEQIITRGHGS